MKITKELLEHFNIVSISLKNNDKNILCFLERIEKNLLTFNVSEELQIKKKRKITFQFTFSDNNTFSCNTCIIENGIDWITVKIENENNKLQEIINEISNMESKYENFGRRKEERIKIGKDKVKEFGLSGLEQHLFLQGIKAIQPCVVLDASVHGICIITPETPALKKEDIFCIKLHFENPVQTVILKAHCVYSKLNKTDSKTFNTLCCQLLEPIHFAWKERVIEMINKNVS